MAFRPTMRIHGNHQRGHRGYTLFEVLLVMAILVAVGAIAVPVFTQAFEIERLRKAGDVLRTAWAKARLEAMTTGLTYVFRFEYGVDRFVISVWDTSGAETETADATIISERAGQLPNGTLFYAGEKVLDARTTETEGISGQTAPQIFFYPDGTTSTAQVQLTNKNDRFLTVELRGLTGVAKVGHVVSADDREQ